MKQSQRMINALARSQRPFGLNELAKAGTRVISFYPLNSEYGSTRSFFARYSYTDRSGWLNERIDHILEFDVTEDQLYPHIRTANTRTRASMVMPWP